MTSTPYLKHVVYNSKCGLKVVMTKVSKHRKLYTLLKEEILGGKYGVTCAFPSEAQLSRRCDCSRITVRKALDELRHEGLIRCRQGRGTVVTEQATAKTFGLILPGVSRYEYFQPIATELARIAQANHCAFLFANIDALEPDELRHNVRELAADFIKRRVSGVVYHPLEFQSSDDTTNIDIVSVFKRAKIPVVLLDSDVVMPPAQSDFDVVSIDNALAAESLTNHLLSVGARSVGIAMLPKMFPNMMERVRGVGNAMLMAGKTWSVSNVLMAAPSNIKAIRAFMKTHPRLDAFVCQNDALAADYARALMKLGYSIPNDIMIAGFDGMDISRVMTPTLTTIRQPYVEIARMVFDMLVRRVKGSDCSPVRVFLSGKLIVRTSTQRPIGKRISKRRAKCS